jgi:ribonuclease P protein subunit RPR2
LARQKSNSIIRHIAEERVDLLLRLAKDAVRSDPSLSKRYVELAQRIAMRSGVRLGPERKQFICKNCKSLLVPGVNCRVRVRAEHGTHVVVTCLECGSTKRYPAVKEKRLRRRR